MLHIIYRIKCLLKCKELIFWSLVFPILLGTMFLFAFGSVNNQFKLMQIELGVVHCEKDDHLMEVLNEMQTDEKKNMFIITEYDDKKDATKALHDEKIIGYIDFENDYALTVMDSNIKTTIIKSILDEYKANVKLLNKVAEKYYAMNHPEKFQAFLEEFAEGQEVKIKEIPLKGRDKDPFTQYYFALLAMTCLIASQVGLENGLNIQPNLSMLGARRNVSPMRKMKQVLYDFIAAYSLYCVITVIVLVVCIFGFKRDFGDNLFFVLLATWVGSFTGMAAGIMISVWVKGTKQKKEVLCTAFFMVSSFLAGLQWGDIVYHIEKSCPIINRINPGTLIVNSYSSLMVFGDVKEYTKNIVVLFLIGILFLGVSILKLRREKYANI